MQSEAQYQATMNQASREQLADEISALTIETALLNGHKVRYGFQRHEILDAEDVRNEFAPDVFRAVALAIAAGDSIEAGRLFAIEHTRAVAEIAKRHAGLRSEYLASLDEQESAADSQMMKGE